MNLNIPDYEKSHVLVVGDLMLDRYWLGETSRISPEAPVPVVHVKDIEERPGGSGNVALNLSTIGTQCSLLAACGDDEASETLETLLNQAKVNCFFLKDKSIPTVTKLRILSNHQQLIRLDFEEKIPAFLAEDLLTQYKKQLPNTQAVILSDYGKGTLQALPELISLACQANVPVFIDPKHHDFSVYHGASFITPNLKEFEAVVGPCDNDADIVEKAQKLIKAHNLQGILVTRGAKGMSLIQRDQPCLHLPTQAREVFDVTGAGDTVIATLAASIAAGKTPMEATALANTAAGIVVGKLGSATTSPEELHDATTKNRILKTGVLNIKQLMDVRAKAKENNEAVVMTNGCFDILHAGHVAYLEQAKSLGKRLVVAVNTDESVKRLKGDERPINPVEMRMAVLAGLKSVDWVIPFNQDTPYELIEQIIPDILVKGGDWQAEDIVGSDIVLNNGGEVRSLMFVDGHSTTSVIEKIRQP